MGVHSNVYAQYCGYNTQNGRIYGIADITPNGSDICSTADIPELSEIRLGGFKNLRKEINLGGAKVWIKNN